MLQESVVVALIDTLSHHRTRTSIVTSSRGLAPGCQVELQTKVHTKVRIITENDPMY